MGINCKAWFLYAGSRGENGKHATLRLESHELPSPGPKDVLAEPIFGCWEGNMAHAIMRKPIDVCHLRREPRVVLGNAGVVRVLKPGSDVKSLKEGDYAMIVAASVVDRWGYPDKIFAYDAPYTMGCLSTKIIAKEHELLLIPESSRYSLAQWAAFAVRYVTAWSNWELAFATFRLLVPTSDSPTPNVWGWSGGTTLAELSLAVRAGCKTVMVSGDDRRLQTIAALGIEPLDRRNIPLPLFDDARVSDPAYRREYERTERAFLDQVEKRTCSEMVQIFVDYLGTPVLRATLKALSREGIITTAGWKEGMPTRFLRSSECIARHQHIHTHYATRNQAKAAMQYGEDNAWMPILEEAPVPFEDVPTLSDRFLRGDVGYFPIYSINPA